MDEEKVLTAEQRAKLPKWARSYIEHVEMRNRDLEREIAKIAAVPTHKPGSITTGHWLVRERAAAGDGESVYFWTGDGDMDYIEVRHDEWRGGTAVHVRTGMTSMMVVPQGGNGILVEPGDTPEYQRQVELMMRRRAREARVPFRETK